MIDEDFEPSRLHLLALAYLLANRQINAFGRYLKVSDICKTCEVDTIRFPEIGDSSWLHELERHGLISLYRGSGLEHDEHYREDPEVALTPAGIYYSVSRASLISENIHGLYRDLPEGIDDAAFAVLNYYSPSYDFAPASDRLVRFNHNSTEHKKAVEAVERVIVALAADNEIGSRVPEVRDEKLAELKEIRRILEKQSAPMGRTAMLAWGALGYLVAEFADRPVGYLADLAWQAIKVVLGI